MKLQKLCYYSQAWSLVWDDAELFNEDFEAWANGPVCRELYYATKGIFSVTAHDVQGNPNNLTDNQKESIRIVLDYYSKHNAQWLSQLTHMEEPWLNARFNVPAGASSSNIISKASMAEYYGGL